MNKKNVIIILIDGGRLDYALNSEKFSKLKSESIFLSQSITYGPHTIASMQYLVEHMELKQEQIVIGQLSNLKKINIKH